MDHRCRSPTQRNEHPSGGTSPPQHIGVDNVARVPEVLGPSTVEEERCFEAANELPAILDLWMAHSPELVLAHSRVRKYLATAMPLPHSFRELANVVIAVEMDSSALLHRHGRTAVHQSGARQEAIDAVRAQRYDRLTDEEGVYAQFVRDVVHGAASDESVDALRERIGNRGVVEYTFLITTNIAWVRFAQALGIESDDRDGLLDDYFDAIEARQPLFRTRIQTSNAEKSEE
jgi:alkylhydroperoxidase family enzyme